MSQILSVNIKIWILNVSSSEDCTFATVKNNPSAHVVPVSKVQELSFQWS